MEDFKLSKYGRILNRFEYPDIYRPFVHHDFMLVHLRCMQNYANDLLKHNGHISIIEVYELLGLPTDDIADSTDGWTYGEGDSYIDFGIYVFDGVDFINRDFVNGASDVIVLDFNVD